MQKLPKSDRSCMHVHIHVFSIGHFSLRMKATKNVHYGGDGKIE